MHGVYDQISTQYWIVNAVLT